MAIQKMQCNEKQPHVNHDLHTILQQTRNASATGFACMGTSTFPELSLSFTSGFFSSISTGFFSSLDSSEYIGTFPSVLQSLRHARMIITIRPTKANPEEK